MPALRFRAALLACVLPPLLSACASVSLADPPAPAAAPAAAAREPAPRADPPSSPEPAESVAFEPAAAPPLVLAAGAPAQPLLPAEAGAPSPAPAERAATSARATDAPGAAVASAAAPAGAPLAPGRWSVQLGVFAVEANAQALRERLAQRLAQAPHAGATDLRTVRRGDRTHVVIGDFADRAGALRLAAQLRELLRQDLVLFQW